MHGALSGAALDPSVAAFDIAGALARAEARSHTQTNYFIGRMTRSLHDQCMYRIEEN